MEKNNEFNQTSGYCNSSSSQMNTDDNFVMNGFFDFSNDGPQNSILDGGVCFPAAAGTTTVAAAEKVQPPYSIGDFGGDFTAYDNTHFSSQLCVPQDDLAELELSTILAEDSYSFTNEELEKLQLIRGMSSSSTSRGPARSQTHRHWSQRSSTDWASSLMQQQQQPATTSGAAVRDRAEPKPRRKVVRENSEGRKCTHCSVDSTPQWRTGPAGPKTLCNACGVRYKSGRLVPEYRPVASPTYVPTEHSNSHRKVLELRRQKAHHQQQDNDDQRRHHHHYHHHHHHDQRHHYNFPNGDHSNNYFDPCFLI